MFWHRFVVLFFKRFATRQALELFLFAQTVGNAILTVFPKAHRWTEVIDYEIIMSVSVSASVSISQLV